MAARFINLRDLKGPIAITENGTLYAGSDPVAELAVVDFGERARGGAGLRKIGGSLYENVSGLAARRPETTKLRQGMLETSNVNPVEEMTQLIKANRLFELDMKGVKTFQDLMGREVNDIGKL